MDTFEMMETKYQAMENAKTAHDRDLIHDSANVAMFIIASEAGFVKVFKNIFPSEN